MPQPMDTSRKRELIQTYGQIVLGCLIGAAAYPTFLVPNAIAPGGLTGIATILNCLGIDIGGIVAEVQFSDADHLNSPKLLELIDL